MLGGKPILVITTVDSQLGAVRQDIRDVKDEIVEVKQKLAAAEQAHNVEKDLLLSLNNQLSGLQNQLSGLQEEKTILLRNQAPSKPCLQLISPHFVLLSVKKKVRCASSIR